MKTRNIVRLKLTWIQFLGVYQCVFKGKAFLLSTQNWKGRGDRCKTYYIWRSTQSFVIDSRSSRGKETKWDVCCFSVQYKDGLPGNPFLLAVYMRSGSSKQIYQSIGCRREQVCHQWKYLLLVFSRFHSYWKNGHVPPTAHSDNNHNGSFVDQFCAIWIISDKKAFFFLWPKNQFLSEMIKRGS